MRDCSPVTEEFLASPEGLCSVKLFSSCLSAFAYSAFGYLTTVFNKKISYRPIEIGSYLWTVDTKLGLGNILSLSCVLK
jgi:hypothetical protein